MGTFIYTDNDLYGYAHNVYVQDGYAYISYATDGFVVANVSNPTNPTLDGFYDTPGYAWGVHPGMNEVVYLTDSHTGLWIFQFTPPPPGVEEEDPNSDVRVSQPSLTHHPNPAKSSARISFSLPNRIQTRLGIYDLTGRQVQVLVDGVREAGSHSVVWDGRDGRGERVASGVYFVRLSAGDITATKKMILLK
ncbi:T9SS type A sorting domain-containing protein [candidate division TA06 bacterium]|nr:T9SS type A sorting domain-containing protein [candidate division TA06 bacterium]